jgi:hypothetical protein
MILGTVRRAPGRLARNLLKYVLLRDVSIRSDRFGRELMMDLAARFLLENRISGAYLEFGAYRGSTFAQAYHSFKRYGLGIPMYAFDSFQGLPSPHGLDASAGYSPFKRGQFSCSQAEFIEELAGRWVPRGAYTMVPGFYEDVLSADLCQRLGITQAAFVWIDCALYESARRALEFVAPILQDGTILVFTSFLRFRGHPAFGERRAVLDFLEDHPQITATEYAKFGSTGGSFVVHLPPRVPPAHGRLAQAVEHA